MNNFSNTHKEDPREAQTSSEETPETLYPYEHDINTRDGSEFLDDAIHMEEQPIGNIETGIAKQDRLPEKRTEIW